jgi:hypothetical protein
MRKGCDFSMSRPAPATLRAAGLEFVLRYVSTPGNSKNVTRAEADRYRGAGIDVGVVFETTAGRALAGAAAGRLDAASARSQIAVASGPATGAVVYFAVDVDTTNDTERQIAAAYLGGAAQALGWPQVGVYGEYEVVTYIAEHTPCRWFFQTYAWSHSQWYPRAQLRQVRNGVHLADGATVDLCEAWADNWGQWPRTGDTGMAMDADVTAAFAAVNKKVDDLGQYLMYGRDDPPAHVGALDLYRVVRRVEDIVGALGGEQPDGSSMDIAARLAAIEKRLDGLTLRVVPAAP